MVDRFLVGSRDLLAGGKVTLSGVALGTQAASQAAFTYYAVTGVCQRGLLWRFVVTADTAGAFDIDVRDAAAGGGNQWLAATGVTTTTYDLSTPIYLQGDATSTLYVGIRNTHSSAHTFTLTTLNLEKFA